MRLLPLYDVIVIKKKYWNTIEGLARNVKDLGIYAFTAAR
jgi:hypothetical protein